MEEVSKREVSIKQKTITSLEVAEMIEKPHDQLMRSIRNYIEILVNEESAILQSHEFFVPSTYINTQNKEQPCYELTKKGCDMVANKMTGSKGVIFTAKYVTRFDEMEQAIKQQQAPMSMEDIIIYQMQQSKMMRDQIDQTQAVALEAKAGVEDTKEELQNMRAVISLDTTSWRTDTADLINKIATYRGGTVNIYQETRREVYELLSKRMGVNLEQRLTNKRRRMADEGVCKSRRDKLSKIDVIAEDKKLIEGFVAIVKEMAIRYGIA